MKFRISFFNEEIWHIYDGVSKQMLDDLRRALNTHPKMTEVTCLKDLVPYMKRVELWEEVGIDDAPPVKADEFRTDEVK